jgi:hypothetical protein
MNLKAVCKCGSTDLTAHATAESVYMPRNGRWVHDAFYEVHDGKDPRSNPATVHCLDCGAEWETDLDILLKPIRDPKDYGIRVPCEICY